MPVHSISLVSPIANSGVIRYPPTRYAKVLPKNPELATPERFYP
jgi:hypothetical protein